MTLTRYSIFAQHVYKVSRLRLRQRLTAIHSQSYSTIHSHSYTTCHNTSHTYPSPLIRNLSTDTTRNETERILHKIPHGRMRASLIQHAIHLIFEWGSIRGIDGARKVEALLERVVAETAYTHINVKPSVYNVCIAAWANVESSEGALRAQKLLERMEQRYKDNCSNDSSISNPQPDTISYNSVCTAWCRSHQRDAPQIVSTILHAMEQNDDKPPPSIITYNILLNTHANQQEIGCAQRAEDVLLKMSGLHKQENSNISPNTSSFNTVLKAWRNSLGGLPAANRAKDILTLMVRLYKEGHSLLKPNWISVKTVMQCYTDSQLKKHWDELLTLVKKLENEELVMQCIEFRLNALEKSGLEDAGDQALKLVDTLVEQYNMNEIKSYPTVRMYASVIGAYANSKDRHIAKKSHEILEAMINHTISIPPNQFCFNKVIHMYVRFQQTDQAEELHTIMKDLSNGTVMDARPDTFTYHTMINLFCQNHTSQSIRKALLYLQNMIDDYDDGHLKYVQMATFNAVLQHMTYSQDHHLAQDALDILAKLEEYSKLSDSNIRLTARVYNDVALIVYKEGDMQKVSELEQRFGMTLGASHFKIIIKNWSTSSAPDMVDRVLQILHTAELLEEKKGRKVGTLDPGVFEEVLFCLTMNPNSNNYNKPHRYNTHQNQNKDNTSLAQNTDSTSNAFKARSVLEKMISHYTQGNTILKPTPTCYNLVLKAQCTHQQYKSNAEFDAHRMLLEMVQRGIDDGHNMPDIFGFNTVLSTLRSSLPKAEELFTLMEHLRTKGISDITPNKYTYSAMLGVLSDSTDPDTVTKAQSIFDNIAPELKDRITYNAFLTVWGKSNQPSKFRKCHETLQLMIKHDKANVSSYNCVLNACSHTKGIDVDQQEVLKIASQVFKELKANLTLDEISFATFMKVIRMTTSQGEKERLLKEVFEDCCHCGLVGHMVVKELKLALSKSTCLNILETDLKGELSHKWTKNVKALKWNK